MKQKILTLILALTLFSGVIGQSAAVFAAGATMTMTANKTTVAAGGSVIVAVYMNGGGDNVNTVQANISYPASKLQYVGVSYTGSAFSITTPDNGGSGGVVVLANGSITPVTGSGLVATLTFKALAASGSAALSFAGGTALVYDNAEVLSAKGGLTLNFGSTASPSSASGSGSSAAKSVAPAPPKDTTAPIISAIKTKAVTPYAASVTWTTNEGGDSAVEYGLDATYGLTVSNTTQTLTHEVALASSFLTPQTLLHYRVKSADGAGNTTVSPDQTIQLPGIALTVIVRGADGKPEVGASVTVDNKTVVTDSKGQAAFTVGLGNKQVVTSVDGVTIKRSITVNKSDKPLPPVQLATSKQPQDRWPLISLLLAIIILILLTIDALMFGSKFLSRLVYRHAYVLHRSSTRADRPAFAATPAPTPSDPALAAVRTKPTSSSVVYFDDQVRGPLVDTPSELATPPVVPTTAAVLNDVTPPSFAPYGAADIAVPEPLNVPLPISINEPAVVAHTAKLSTPVSQAHSLKTRPAHAVHHRVQKARTPKP
ncbi:MAG: Fibronectin, type domain protein [Candidatus Saccharibacteria bacterium]|nr:Fibronectin, type domain protein [Candidatus Saccharibacteria bacterium]